MSINVTHISDRVSGERLPHHVVADNLNAELARRRISGRQAAKAMGLSQAYVARRISGDTELSVSDLLSFATLLGVDVSVLLDGALPDGPSPLSGVGPAKVRPTD